MTGYTDYPLVELGDTPGVEAPIRSITILSYDEDKYVTVEVGGITVTIKRWYCYKTPSRYGDDDARWFSNDDFSKLSSQERKAGS